MQWVGWWSFNWSFYACPCDCWPSDSQTSSWDNARHHQKRRLGLGESGNDDAQFESHHDNNDDSECNNKCNRLVNYPCPCDCWQCGSWASSWDNARHHQRRRLGMGDKTTGVKSDHRQPQISSWDRSFLYNQSPQNITTKSRPCKLDYSSFQ